MILANFDKNTLVIFRRKLEEMFDQFQQDTGVKLKIGTIRYDDRTLRTTLEGCTETVDGTGDTFEKITWDRCCGRYGLKPEHFGQTIDLGFGRKYKLVGIKSRNRKYPILAQKDDGKRYKLTSADVRQGLTL